MPEKAQPKESGAFAGVFTPTLLTIADVILFLRGGWGVGNAGLVGAPVIIILAFAITGCTALSLSSIAMISVVVLIEQRLGLLSSRPLLQIPRVIALFGTAGCLLAKFIVSPTMSLEDEAETEQARAYLEQVVDLVRLTNLEIEGLIGDREKLSSQGPVADLNAFSIGGPLDCAAVRARVDQTRSSRLFAKNSGDESALV